MNPLWHFTTQQTQKLRSFVRCYTTETKKSSNSQYVINHVRKYDYESYLCILLLPSAKRYPAFVINAYNVELSLVLEQARDQRAVSGRLAFWEDALNGIFIGKKPYNHPVVNELDSVYNSILCDVTLSRKWLGQILKGRLDLSKRTHLETVKQLEDYCEHTKSSVLYLMLAAGGHSDLNIDHAASHLGRCLGLLNALRSTPYLTSKNQLLLPQDILTKHKVSQQDVLKGREIIKEPVYEIACMAHQHLQTANNLIGKVKKSALSYFLPSSICERKLEALRQCDFNVFDNRFLKRDSMLAWHLWKQRMKIRFK